MAGEKLSRCRKENLTYQNDLIDGEVKRYHREKGSHRREEACP